MTASRDVISPQRQLKTADLDYDLSPELIATRPAEPRDSARLMVVSRSSEVIEHARVSDLPRYLQPNDLLIFNNTAVAPARFIGRRVDSGGRVEGLFLREMQDASPSGSPGDSTVCWLMMLKAGGRLKPGLQIEWSNRQSQPSGVRAELVKQQGPEWIVRLAQGWNTQAAFDAAGWTPLPPYILHARGNQTSDLAGDLDALDRDWYQTVYADLRQRGSVAAPTAGLHFTPALLDRLAAGGVRRGDVTLHVGAGTFKPVTAETLAEHRMHAEWFEVPAETCRAIDDARSRGSRIFAVGTTSVRTVESLARREPETGKPVLPGDLYGAVAGMTDLLIAPPFDFQFVDGMLTNFHLPRSTLMALVAAMLDRRDGAGSPQQAIERLKFVYREAIQKGYRFYSYGDAMLILP